ncbi:hypothetical protein [Roseiconus lacunae]|uniref:Restriction endonuclease n=1 Tax=Roseiconus lacunae TaxID=2605694 RepID=A0ABT7PNU1_9BACT|nr:hypothetical protein [Roseiconus lacunae]MDM4018175.1 hypothetical protein [Roseiconus lacunae]
MKMSSSQIRSALSREFATLEFARAEFPMLTTWGVRDESVSVHSLGFNYLAALGRHLGFWAATEYPIRVGNTFVRPDFVWWSKDDQQVKLIGEFERYEAGQQPKLIDKAKNLMLSYEALERSPEAMVLVPWTLSGTDLAGNSAARSVAYDGFRSSGGKRIPGVGTEASFLLAHAIFGNSEGNVRLLEVKL